MLNQSSNYDYPLTKYMHFILDGMSLEENLSITTICCDAHDCD